MLCWLKAKKLQALALFDHFKFGWTVSDICLVNWGRTLADHLCSGMAVWSLYGLNFCSYEKKKKEKKKTEQVTN